MCFPNKRENACMFPIKPPKKLGNAHMFCIPRGPMVGNAHVLFLCFFVFPKNDKIQSFILRRAQADWQQSGPANLSKRKRKKTKNRTVRWRSWQRQHGGPKMKKPSFACCDLHVLPLQNAKNMFHPKNHPKDESVQIWKKNAGKKLWKL